MEVVTEERLGAACGLMNVQPQKYSARGAIHRVLVGVSSCHSLGRIFETEQVSA
jgi:hypothetical protein